MPFNASYKMIANLIKQKLKVQVEKIIRDYENGFRPKRSMINSIRTLQQIMRNLREYNKDLHIIFINFRTFVQPLDRSK